MSCEHGNWAPCEQCDALDALHAEIAELRAKVDKLVAAGSSLALTCFTLQHVDYGQSLEVKHRLASVRDTWGKALAEYKEPSND